MVSRRTFIVSGFLTCVLLALSVVTLQSPSGPQQEGRSLCYWLTRLNSDDSDESARAYAAVAAIGPRGLPTFRSLLALRDNAFKKVLRAAVARLPLRLEVRSPEYWRFRARLGLAISGILLSEDSGNLLPDCRSMLRDADPRVREDAIEIVGGMLDRAAPALPDLELALKDTDAAVCRAADVAVRNVRRNLHIRRFGQTQKTQPDAARNSRRAEELMGL